LLLAQKPGELKLMRGAENANAMADAENARGAPPPVPPSREYRNYHGLVLQARREQREHVQEGLALLELEYRSWALEDAEEHAVARRISAAKQSAQEQDLPQEVQESRKLQAIRKVFQLSQVEHERHGLLEEESRVQLEELEVKQQLQQLEFQERRQEAELVGRSRAVEDEAVQSGRNHSLALEEIMESLVAERVFNASSNFNRTYGPGRGNTHWEGALSDTTRSRGTVPGPGPGQSSDVPFEYFCPSGWKRFAVNIKDFDETQTGRGIVYHGSSKEAAALILKSCIRASCCSNGKLDGSLPSAYVSPSIEYCAHPTYATPFKMNDGSWGQVVLQCRLDPSAFQSYEQATVLKDQASVVDGNYANHQMEWVVAAPKDAARDASPKLTCYGLMFRNTKEHPDTLPASRWWQECHSRFGDKSQDYGASRGNKEAAEKAKQEAAEKAKQEAAEKAKQEAAEKAPTPAPAPAPRSSSPHPCDERYDMMYR
jgi:hypothetical protein